MTIIIHIIVSIISIISIISVSVAMCCFLAQSNDGGQIHRPRAPAPRSRRRCQGRRRRLAGFEACRGSQAPCRVARGGFEWCGELRGRWQRGGSGEARALPFSQALAAAYARAYRKEGQDGHFAGRHDLWQVRRALLVGTTTIQW